MASFLQSQISGGCTGVANMTHNLTYDCAAQSHRSESNDIDQRVFVEVHRKLKDSGYASLGNLKCHVVQGRITLQGNVPSFYLKQVAQSLAASLDEHLVVNNLVEVTRKPVPKK